MNIGMKMEGTNLQESMELIQQMNGGKNGKSGIIVNGVRRCKISLTSNAFKNGRKKG